MDFERVPLQFDNTFDQLGIPVQHFLEVLPIPTISNLLGTLEHSRTSYTLYIVLDFAHLTIYFFEVASVDCIGQFFHLGCKLELSEHLVV